MQTWLPLLLRSDGGSHLCGGSEELMDLTELSGSSCQLLEVLQGRVGVQ